MGMFDSLRCRFPLPVPAVQDRLFQTKSLDCQMDHYCLREDGTLWRRQDPPDPPVAQGESHPLRPYGPRQPPREVFCGRLDGPVEFYADYGKPPDGDSALAAGWVEFRAVFAQGCLRHLEVIEHTEPPEVAAVRLSVALDAALPGQKPAPPHRL